VSGRMCARAAPNTVESPVEKSLGGAINLFGRGIIHQCWRHQPEADLAKVFALRRQMTVELRTNGKRDAPFSNGSSPRPTYGSENSGHPFFKCEA